MKHTNNGKCEKCLQIFHKFKGPHPELLAWFQSVQAIIPEFHACEVGRNALDQEIYFQRGASKARWKQSAHNYNVGCDTFFLVDGKYNVSNEWYKKVEKLIPLHINWYGARTASFPEKPHFELRSWKELREKGLIKLVA